MGWGPQGNARCSVVRAQPSHWPRARNEAGQVSWVIEATENRVKIGW